MRCLLVVLATLVAVVSLAAPTAAASPAADVILQVRAGAACTHATALVSAGATRIDARLRLWRVPAGVADGVERALRRDQAVAFVQREQVYSVAARTDLADPLVPNQWWRATVGVVDLVPPGPGIPVTLVDSGVFFGHEEFATRPPERTRALNEQQPADIGGEHGTSVASVIGAPVNGVGLAGIYPDAVLQSYDAAIGDGLRLETGEIVAGVLAAARSGRGVINLSLGGEQRDIAIELAVYEAVKLGSLVVAAAGNSGDSGNPLEYPAAVPHVLTVGATDREDKAAIFSSRSAYVDLAAPGVGIPVASATRGPYTEYSGTSFSAPMVSGAAAWLWTLHPELEAGQIAEILKRSARDVDAPGRDDATGYGILNVPAALALPVPAPDPREPNDDIEYVDPDSEYFNGFAPFTTKGRPRGTVAGRIVRLEDPRDVLRTWLPRNRTVRISVTASVPVTLALFKQGSATVVGKFAEPDRLAWAPKAGATLSISYKADKKGQPGFVVVGFPRSSGGRQAEYTVTVT